MTSGKLSNLLIKDESEFCKVIINERNSIEI